MQQKASEHLKSTQKKLRDIHKLKSTTTQRSRDLKQLDRRQSQPKTPAVDSPATKDQAWIVTLPHRPPPFRSSRPTSRAGRATICALNLRTAGSTPSALHTTFPTTTLEGSTPDKVIWQKSEKSDIREHAPLLSHIVHVLRFRPIQYGPDPTTPGEMTCLVPARRSDFLRERTTDRIRVV